MTTYRLGMVRYERNSESFPSSGSLKFQNTLIKFFRDLDHIGVIVISVQPYWTINDSALLNFHVFEAKLTKP